MRLVSSAERPDLAPLSARLLDELWPAFMHHDPIANRLWPRLFEHFADCQLFIVDREDAIAAVANAVPFCWSGMDGDLPDGGWDAVLEQGIRDIDAGIGPTALSALSVTVLPARRGQGLAQQLLEALKHAGRSRSISHLVAPVRPTRKSHYPLAPFDRYVRWERDGEPFDPWIRVHRRMGGRIVKPAWRSMVITGSVADWEGWTGLCFPESGPYVVPEALIPVAMDCEQDEGVYAEPNLWMHHLM